MSYRRRLNNGFLVLSTVAEHADQLEALQRLVFPTLTPEEHFRAEHYRHHVEIFPAGQFVVVDGEAVVGMTSSIRYNFDPDGNAQHAFREVFDDGWLGSHRADGSWLYGVDIGTHPRYRGQGIARALYRARQVTVRDFGLKGQVTVGLLNGYGAVQQEMSPDEYYRRLVAGDLMDPTVSAQMHLGFQPQALVTEYVDATRCAGCGVLLVLDAQHDI